MTVDVLHAPRAAPFVAVVEVEAFALEDESSYAILGWKSVHLQARTSANVLGRSMSLVEPIQASCEDYRDRCSIFSLRAEEMEESPDNNVVEFQVLAFQSRLASKV